MESWLRLFVAHAKICSWRYFNRFEDKWVANKSGNIREFWVQSGNIRGIRKIFRKTRENQGSCKLIISCQTGDFLHTQSHTQFSMTFAKLSLFLYHLLAAKSDLNERKGSSVFYEKVGTRLSQIPKFSTEMIKFYSKVIRIFWKIKRK